MEVTKFAWIETLWSSGRGGGNEQRVDGEFRENGGTQL